MSQNLDERNEFLQEGDGEGEAFEEEAIPISGEEEVLEVEESEEGEEEGPAQKKNKRGGRIRGTGPSPIWDHFTKTQALNVLGSACKLCTFKASHRNSGNLAKHLECLHPKEFKLYRQKIVHNREEATAKLSKGSSRPASSQSLSSSSNSSLTNFFAPKGGKCYPQANATQQMGVRACAFFCADNGVAPNLMASKGFKLLCHTLNPRFTPPSPFQTRRCQEDMFADLQLRLIDILQGKKVSKNLFYGVFL